MARSSSSVITRLVSTRMQFFLAIAGTSLLLMVIVLAGLRSAFVNNFSAYLYEQEQQRLERVAVTVSEYYESTLQQLRAQGVYEISEAALWRRILGSIQRDSLLQQSSAAADFDLNSHAMSLTTVHGYQVFGEVKDDPLTVGVFAEGELIASLSAPSPELALQPVDTMFATQQQRAWWWAGGLALVVGGVVAWLLANVLGKRLARLRFSTQQLAAGNYQYPIADSAGRWRAHDEISELTAAIATLAANLAATETQRRQFMSDIAHELRTPLTVLKGELEAVNDGIRQPSHAFCLRLLQQTNQLNVLINDLATLTQAGAGSLAYEWQPVSIVHSIQAAIASLQPAMQAVQLHFTFNHNNLEPQVQGDAARLQQVWMNLLNNSLRYTQAPGRVVMQVVEHEAFVTVTLEDSAPSVAPAHLARLFERFYRIDAHRQRKSGGSGLGLAIVAEIIAAHGGTITAQPSVLGGLLIEVQIPRLVVNV